MQNSFLQNNNINNTIIDDEIDNENEEVYCCSNNNVCRVNGTNHCQQEQQEEEEELECAEEDVINKSYDNKIDTQNERSDGEVKEVHLHPLLAEYVQRNGNYFGTDALVGSGGSKVHAINDNVASGDAVTRVLLRKRQDELNRLISLIPTGNTEDYNMQELIKLFNYQQGIDRNLPYADDLTVENKEIYSTSSSSNSNTDYNNYNNNCSNTIKMLTWHGPNSVDSEIIKTENNECAEPEEDVISETANNMNSNKNDIGLYKRTRYSSQQEEQHHQGEQSDFHHNNLYSKFTDMEEMTPVKRTRHDETFISNNYSNKTSSRLPISNDNVSSLAAALPSATAKENNYTLSQNGNDTNRKAKHLKRSREVDDDAEAERKEITE